jgi:carnitine 3-dehydrogenase
MATNLDQFGPALKLPWTRLEAPELTKELRDRMVNGCNAVAKDQAFEDMVSQRDREIVAVLNALRQARLM